eukprot:1444735-Ditylum_brightwellii.AAC.1
MASLSKLAAEARAEEEKMTLGCSNLGHTAKRQLSLKRIENKYWAPVHTSLDQVPVRALTKQKECSCPAGLGGYSHDGRAWCFYLPPSLQFRASNNVLEHLASIITPWIDILEGLLEKGD